MHCEGASDQYGLRAWLLDGCVISGSQSTREAREKALRPPRPAGAGIGEAVVLQRGCPPKGEEGESLREGVASRLPLSVGSTRVGATVVSRLLLSVGSAASAPLVAARSERVQGVKRAALAVAS